MKHVSRRAALSVNSYTKNCRVGKLEEHEAKREFTTSLKTEGSIDRLRPVAHFLSLSLSLILFALLS